MGLFNIFGKKKEEKGKRSTEKVTYNFTDEQITAFVKKSIAAFYNNREKDANIVMDAIDDITDDEECTYAIYCFLPIVLCHVLFPEPTYPDYYTVFRSKDDYTEHMLVDNQMYNVILKMAPDLLNNLLASDETYAILAHSSEFKAMNEALHNGSQLEDLEMSPVCFIA